MKVAYVAGKYRAPTPRGIVENIRGGGDVTPPRLTLAEVDALAYRAILGKRGAREALMEALRGIPEAIGQKYWRIAHYRGLETADLEQEARCALLAALDTWKPAKGTFRTHAYGMARFKVLDAINDAHTVSISSAVATAAADESLDPGQRRGGPTSPATLAAAARAVRPCTPISTSPTDEDEDLYANPGGVDAGYDDSVDALALAQILRRARLPSRQRKAVAARFRLPGALSMGELADKEGVSKQAISNQAKRGLARLRTVAGTERGAS